MTKKNRTTKFILSFLIILIIVPTVLFSQPKKAHATLPVADWLNTTFHALITGSSGGNTILHGKDFVKEILRQVIIVLGHQFLNQLTQSTVNWINSGFHGSPLFVPNSTSFFNSIEQTAIKNVVNQVGYDPLQPFGKQFALNVINQYRAKSTQDMQYSLSQITNDPVLLKNYQTNFAYGGWNAFLVNTQYPQNNYLGYTMKMSNILYGQTTTANTGKPAQNLAQKATTLLSQGSGFLSPSQCPSNINPNYNTMANEFDPPTFKVDYGGVPNIPDCQPKANTAAGCSNQTDINNAIDQAGSANGSATTSAQAGVQIPNCIFIFSATNTPKRISPFFIPLIY